MNAGSYGGDWSLDPGLTAHTEMVLGRMDVHRESKSFLCLCSHGAFIHWYVSEKSETVLSPNLMPRMEKDCH